MKLITLTTDFGMRDGNVGVMKGVIWGLSAEAKIADLTHEISPQNIHQAAWALNRQVFYFPPGTVHVVVVDPGVGTSRRPVAGRFGDQYAVGPDNGVFTPLFRRSEKEGWPLEIVHLDRPEFRRDEVSHVFHGRDIFAPAGAHLANGVSLGDLGTPIRDPVPIPWPEPVIQPHEVRGKVMHVDHFGNLATNIYREHLAILPDTSHARVTVAEECVTGLIDTFGEREPGTLVALYGSTGYLFIAVVNGSAADRLGLGVGAAVNINW